MKKYLLIIFLVGLIGYLGGYNHATANHQAYLKHAAEMLEGRQ